MRRLLTMTLLILLTAVPVLAQDAATPTPLPPDNNALATAAAQSVTQSMAAAADARASAEDAERFASEAFNFLGLFEAFSVVIGVSAVVLGIVGVTRLFSAENQLVKARERIDSEFAETQKRFDEEMANKSRELQSLREQLLATVEQQHKTATQATLALALLPLGERQYKAQDMRGAADTYLRALALDGDNPLIHYRLGYVYVQSGQLDDAETHLKQALAIDSEFVLAMAALGYVYRRMGDKMHAGVDRDQMHNQAEYYLLQALKRSPKLVDDDSESWWGSLGGLYRRRGQVDQAIYAYEQAGQVTPQSSYPFSNLALLYMAKGDRAKMLDTYKRVERLARGEAVAEVNNYWAYADLLTARLALGKLEDAEDAMITVSDLAPVESPYALEMLVDTLTRLTEALGGASAAPHIPPYIERIRSRMRQNEGG